MKKFVIAVIFLFSLLTQGQGSEIEISNFTMYIRGDEKICNNNIKLTLFFKDGGREEIFHGRGRFEGTRNYQNINRSYPNRVIDRIELYANTVEKQGTKCHNDDPSITTEESVAIKYTPCPAENKTFYKVNSGEFEVEHRIKFRYFVKPIPKVYREGIGIAGYDDPLKAKGDDSFGDPVYAWQYQITEIGASPIEPLWLYIPNAAIHKKLSVLPRSFLPPSTIGKEIHIRAKSRCVGTTASSYVSYDLRRSAPHIVKNLTDPSPTSCYNLEDGKVVITFDRDLDPDIDILEYTIIDPENGDPISSSGETPIKTLESGNKLTIYGLKPSTTKFRIDILGSYNGVLYFTDGDDHHDEFKIERPSYVRFDNEPQDTVVDNWCFESNDGQVSLKASGGTNSYFYRIRTINDTFKDDWIPFTSGFDHTIQGLKANTYKIQIRDSNRCEARVAKEVKTDQFELGIIIEKEVIVGQPEAPLTVKTEILNQPTAFGFKDGRISAIISGGSKFDDQSYHFEWRNTAGDVLSSTFTTIDADGNYQITLHSIGSGDYFLNAWDKNYDAAINKVNCSFLNATESLKAPNPLEVNIETINEISCNNGNEFFNFKDSNVDDIVDQFQDGVLKVIATGGEPISEDNPYEYTWKVKESGVWRDLNKNEKIIDFLSTAHYAVNIKDKNNIVLGDYAEYTLPDGSRAYKLIQEKDSVKFLPQPEKLNITFDKINSSCAAVNDASATVNITGGTPPYTYKWNNNKTTKENDNLASGIYFVAVQDAKGCEIEGSVNIEQPEGLMVSPIEIINPTCYGGDDGHIELKISGGTPPYSYYWDDESTALALTGLKSGSYQFNVKDAIGCSTFYEVDLVDPEPINIDLGSNRTICAQQTLLLDIEIQDSNATYQWSSDTGFESTKSAVELDKPGTYTATVTTGLGCVGTTSIVVTVLDTPIDADFLITTQAFIDEELILVNVSEPIGDLVEWIVPEHVKIISETDSKLVLSFDKTGPYDIQLKSHQGDCFEDLIKTIIVQPAQDEPNVDRAPGNFIKEFIIYPNPNTGTFKVKIGLAEASNINLKIINLISAETLKQYTEMNKQEFLIDYSVDLPSGVYLLWLETSRGSETRKLVIQ